MFEVVHNLKLVSHLQTFLFGLTEKSKQNGQGGRWFILPCSKCRRISSRILIVRSYSTDCLIEVILMKIKNFTYLLNKG